jgi:hypothetical protein
VSRRSDTCTGIGETNTEADEVDRSSSAGVKAEAEWQSFASAGQRTEPQAGGRHLEDR